MTVGADTAPVSDRTPLERMLEARSVAVVGASVKTGSVGHQMMVELRRGGFDGGVYPVNPRYDEVDGYPCFGSIGEVPVPVDLAILGVSNERVEDTLRDAAAAGAASALTFASLHEEAGSSPSLAERVTAIARDAGMAFCGGNGMGFLNPEARLRATGFPTPDRLAPGPVAFVSHSGSAFAALAFNDRGIGFNLIVSSGQELVTDVADYMDYALAKPSTRVLALFLETVRRPEPFIDALERAAHRDVPVLAIKVGRTEASKSLVTAHSGALAGEDGAYEALFDAYGVLRVTTLGELADAMELFSCPRRVTRGTGIASIHDSGGERALFVDVAGDVGTPFAQISEFTTEAIQDVLDPGLVAGNPLDAWGTGIDHERIFTTAFAALHEDPTTAAMAFVIDLTRQGQPYEEGYLHIARSVFATTDKPFCVISNLASAVAEEEAALLRADGIPVLEGTRSGLLALRHLLAQRDFRERPSIERPDPVDDAVRDRWSARLASGGTVTEIEALRLLADYGIPTVAARDASSADAAVAAAEEVGWPVAIKTAASGIQHKSDVDGVRLGLRDAAEVRTAYEDVAGRLGPDVVVAEMTSPGVEMALGVVRDSQFGPLVMVAAGGLLVELLHDRRLALPPFDPATAARMVDGLQVRPLLHGLRGAPPADLGALAGALSRLSVLAADLGDLVVALDVNPLIVTPNGCAAVDALVLSRRTVP